MLNSTESEPTTPNAAQQRRPDMQHRIEFVQFAPVPGMFLQPFHYHKTKRSYTTSAFRRRDEEIPDELWSCALCQVKASMTPMRRRGADGRKSLCNACYTRQRVNRERSERGTSRPIINDQGVATFRQRQDMPVNHLPFPAYFQSTSIPFAHGAEYWTEELGEHVLHGGIDPVKYR